MDCFTIKIAGPAGAGIKSSGLLLSQILIAHGFYTRDYSEYPSLVRGGHNTYQVTFSQEDIFTVHYSVDAFFSLLPGHWQAHQSEFTTKTLIFAQDSPLALPLNDLASTFGSIYSNTICLGVAAYIFNLDLPLCQQIVSVRFGTDNPNSEAFLAGYNYAQVNYSTHHRPLVTNIGGSKNQFCYDGNEAFGWGFIQGGGNFFTSYPMTPASGALHFLAGKQDQYHLKVIHPEDEIAAASLAAGAAFAGARVATATSGGGFALMNETVSFCGIANIGVVFYLVSRPGPATGLPTWTAQGDLLYAIHSGHGEFVKIVLAPGDQQETFNFAALSLNLAAKFNLPVILLSDKFISESTASLPDFSKIKFKQIKSALPIPGTPDQEYMANSYEHDDDGYSTEDAATVNLMVKKRLSMIKSILPTLPKPIFYGNALAKKLIISWGSTKSTILEALRILHNPQYAYLQIRSLWPLDPKIEFLIKPFKEIIVIENNATGQLTTLLKSQFDFHPTATLLRFDGRPFFPEELIKKFKID